MFINSCTHSFLTYLDKVSKWLISNQLNLNINKNKFFNIGSSQRLKKLNSITTDDKSIEEGSSFSYLGVVINNHLISWQDHIDYISNIGTSQTFKIMFSYILPIFD